MCYTYSLVHSYACSVTAQPSSSAQLRSLDNETTSRRVKVLTLHTHRPANLPFSLLEWGRAYIRGVNDCVRKVSKVTLVCSLLDSFSLLQFFIFGCTLFYHFWLQSICVLLSCKVSRAGGPPCNELFPSFSKHRIRYVYYTESDQILHFATTGIRRAVLAATNSSTFLIGRRMEKLVHPQPPPASYMHLLSPTRALCGDPKDAFVLDWPGSHFIQKL